jgi:hypothetical protein
MDQIFLWTTCYVLFAVYSENQGSGQPTRLQGDFVNVSVSHG